MNSSDSSDYSTFIFDYDEEEFNNLATTTFVPPTWMIEFVEFRKRLFLAVVEPIIVTILGPVVVVEEQQHRLHESESMMMMLPEFDDDPMANAILNQSSYYDYHSNSTNALVTFDTTTNSSTAGGIEGNSSTTPWMMANNDSSSIITSYARRRLSFLPSYVEDIDQYRETSMSFATLAMLFVIMSCMLLVFLSCFYHNQKTSPLFISPRRHRLPKLVPPPLPVDGYFSWVRTVLVYIICFVVVVVASPRVGISSLSLSFFLHTHVSYTHALYVTYIHKD